MRCIWPPTGSACANRAENFTLDDIPSAVAFAHAAGVKVYVTVNTLMSQADIAALPPYLEALDLLRGADALLVSDLGAIFRRNAMPRIWSCM